MKNILLLGASGSIGTQTIEVLKQHPDKLVLKGASVGKNVAFLKELLKDFKLEYAYALNVDQELKEAYPDVRFYSGDDGLLEIVKEESYDLLINALVGFTGFKPTLIAIENHKNIALANKETLVAGGELITKAVKENGVELLPIDSEHSALLQCIRGHKKEDIHRLIITASGGAFRDKTRNELKDVKAKDALKHPTWNMGSKITIDSATMMNKGFEIMEAHFLYNLDYDDIDVMIQPTSMVHSMVEYKDGTTMAQMSYPDMRLPIRYALLYPDNVNDELVSYLDVTKMLSVEFLPMDYKRFPLVAIAKKLGKFGGNFGAVLIGANDEAVDLFLNDRISFLEIEDLVINTLKAAHFIRHPSADELIESNKWAKEYVRNCWANS